jgi:hypothetical protein
MWFGARGDIDPPPLGEAPLPPLTKATVLVPCGERFDWDEASWHYLDCDECHTVHKARNFVDPSMG